MSEKPVQLFSDEYLEHCQKLTPDQIARFLDQFRQIAFAAKKKKSKLISLKINEDLLEAFRFKARLEGRPYQTVIKDLMLAWLKK